MASDRTQIRRIIKRLHTQSLLTIARRNLLIAGGWMTTSILAILYFNLSWAWIVGGCALGFASVHYVVAEEERYADLLAALLETNERHQKRIVNEFARTIPGCSDWKQLQEWMWRNPDDAARASRRFFLSHKIL